MSEESKQKPQDLHERLLEFAARVGLMYRELPHGKLEEVYGLQVVRSSSSVGAQMREAKRTRSKAEFISKSQSAQQELEESLYWFDLMVRTKIVCKSRMKSLRAEGCKLMKIMSTWILNAKENR